MNNKYEIIPIKINLHSPVIIPNNEGDENIVLSENFITGSALLGLFAGQYIKSKKLVDEAHKDISFCDFFLSDDFIFSNAYKMVPDGRISIPLPLSLQAPKTDKENVKDLLFDNMEEAAKPVGGFKCLHFKNNECHITKVPVEKARSLHHKRTDQKVGSSQDKIIFNYEYLLPHQSFGGYIIGPETKIQAFQEWWDKTELSNFRLGRSKSNEYGQVTIERINPTNEKKLTELMTKPISLDKDNNEFTLSFLSPVILKNKFGYSEVSRNVLIDYLCNELGIKESGAITIQTSFIRSSNVESYVSVWKAKKPSESAFVAGSCFKITVNFNDVQQYKKINSLLERLQYSGIGERRNEGFGRIAVNMQQKYEKYNLSDSDSDASVKPELLPDSLVSVIKYVFDMEIQSAVNRLALEQIELFGGKKPSSSLLSRMQSILKVMDYNGFIVKMEGFADPAKDQLKNCKSRDGKSLYELMLRKVNDQKGDTYLEDICQRVNELREMQVFKDQGINCIEECLKAQKIFFLDLFNLMQRENKGSK